MLSRLRAGIKRRWCEWNHSEDWDGEIDLKTPLAFEPGAINYVRWLVKCPRCPREFVDDKAPAGWLNRQFAAMMKEMEAAKSDPSRLVRFVNPPFIT